MAGRCDNAVVIAHALMVATGTIVKTGVNFEQAIVTTTGVVICICVVMTLITSRLDKNRAEQSQKTAELKADLSAMISAIASSLGVRLDQLDAKQDRTAIDVAEIKGMSKVSQRRDQEQDK
jgi:hypothetical protein